MLFLILFFSGFEIRQGTKEHCLRPSSAHSMWTAYQVLDQAIREAALNNLYEGKNDEEGSWKLFYQEQINKEAKYVNQW